MSLLRTYRRKLRLVGLALPFVFAYTQMAMAQSEPDPFAVEKGAWMSMDHYQDSEKRGMLPSQPEESPPESAVQNVEKTAAAPPVSAAPVPSVSKESRKGFQIQINSTVDEAPRSPPIRSELSVPQATPEEEGLGPPQKPLDIRYSALPKANVAPPPFLAPDHSSGLELGRAQLLAKQAQKQATPPKASSDPALCAIVDSYKKQELNAIQNDRQTLQALQSAVRALGLQKQLGFMSGNESVLNMGEDEMHGMVEQQGKNEAIKIPKNTPKR